LDYDCHIWYGDAYKNYLHKVIRDKDIVRYLKSYSVDTNGVPTIEPYSKEEFIKEIKTNNEFAKKWGELGPIYGKQWRQWQGWMDMDGNVKGSLWYDQILRLVHSLKTNPDSRRLMVSAWNVGELDLMVLPPCHYGFQVYTRELDETERVVLMDKKLGITENLPQYYTEDEMVKHNIPKRAISLMWNQRSVDTFLGLPFNIASYGLLLEILAKEVNMVPDELIGNLGDTHLYLNHIEQAKEQIGRDLTDEERYNKWFKNNVVSGMERFFDANNLPDFDDPYYVVTPKRTREPFKLPTIEITERNWYQHQLVKEHLGPKPFSEKILSYRPDCFELIGYESHPKIKAPLSN
jgi:thymidylate synthase